MKTSRSSRDPLADKVVHFMGVILILAAVCLMVLFLNSCAVDPARTGSR